VSAHAGRLGRRLDENVHLDRPLDGHREISRDIARTGRRARRLRACAVGGVIVCALVAPATAWAADPFGTAQLTQEVNAAVTQATAAVPATTAQTLSAQTVAAATKTVDAVTRQAAAAASNAAAEAQRQAQRATTVASVPAASGTAVRARVRTHRRTTRRRAPAPTRSSASRGSLTPHSTRLASAESSVPRQLTASSAGGSADRAQDGGAQAAGTAPRPTRQSLPQRSPPLPLPPQPGAALSGQGGGHGPSTTPILAALTAVLLLIAFEFLPRTLPPRAFRKPRQIALRPEHPG
jgi:hypothetical protein